MAYWARGLLQKLKLGRRCIVPHRRAKHSMHGCKPEKSLKTSLSPAVRAL